MSTESGYILAHDFGTSAVKSSLFTIEGELTKSVAAAYPTYHTRETWAEQDPEDWWRAFCLNNKMLLEPVDRESVLCVSFSGAYPNCLCVDTEMKPLHRAMIWQDARAAEETRLLNTQLESRGLPPVSADRTLPKLLWIKKHLPEHFAGIYKVIPSAADYIILKITGMALCDHGTACGTAMFDRDNNRWSGEILELSEISDSFLPEPRGRTEIAGEVPAHLEDECGLAAGTKLVMGTGDSACTSIGAGLFRPGDAYISGGTSAEVIALDKDGKKLGRPTASSGASLNWLKNTICLAEQRIAEESGRDAFDIICEMIVKAPVGSNGVMFHPYLAGERATRNNLNAKGSFVGISLATTRADLIRSVVEGIGFNLNLLLEDIRNQGLNITRMPIVGGLGKSPALRQVFADIMNVEIISYEYMDEAAAVGAAVLGGIALGLYKDETAAERFMKIVSITTPTVENHEKYARLIPLFEKVYEAQLPLYELMDINA